MRSHFVKTVIEGSSRVIWMERALSYNDFTQVLLIEIYSTIR